MLKFIAGLLGVLTTPLLFAQSLKNYEQPQSGNPVIPGYFADPTIKKIGDTYYMYATTDGNGGGLGPGQVWTSKDFVNWKIQQMNWPNTHWYWAPDMTKGYDGRYYLYYSQPVELYGGVSDSPAGPWTSIVPDNKSFIPNYMIPGVITLDGQTFTDDDGKIYMYWGTWGIYPDHGCAVGLLNKDMKTFEKVELIPNTVAKEFFEAPFVFKRNGIYYFMYSSGHCEDHTYRVQYVKSKVGPMGPFEWPKDNPVLSTTADGTIHGPGHHSILQEGDKYYIVYHRHNNPNSGGGFHRQLAADLMEFDEDGDIIAIKPTHNGIGHLGKNTQPQKNLALGAKVTASSFYSNDFRPAFAADDNNGTLWKAADNMQPAWLEIDLGSEQPIQTIHTQFEYATYYYQYAIETSVDRKNWTVFADRKSNVQWGSPFIDKGNTKARYVRIHIQNTQLPGMFKAIWNIKIYSEANVGGEMILSEKQKVTPDLKQQGLLVDIDARDFQLGEGAVSIKNKGVLGGSFGTKTETFSELVAGRQGIVFNGKNSFISDFKVPLSLTGNSSFSVAMWVYNPTIERNEPILNWTKGTVDLSRAQFGHGYDKAQGAVVHGAWPDMAYKNAPKAGKWQHVVVTFDGYMEKIYVDGQLDNSGNKMLFLQGADFFTLGASAWGDQHYSGLLGSLKIYDKAISTEELNALYTADGGNGYTYYFKAKDLPYGALSSWTNDGFNGEGTTNNGVEVTDVAGKIAVKGNVNAVLGSTTLAALLNDKANDYTFTATVNSTKGKSPLQQLMTGKFQDGKWYLLHIVQKNGNRTIFINGNKVAYTDKQYIALWDAGKNGLKMQGVAFSEIGVRNRAVTDIELGKEVTAFKLKTAKRVEKGGFSKSPVQINTQSIFMGATPADEQDVLYYFFDEKNGIVSGWQKHPYYLVNAAEKKDFAFAYKVKDKDGNVSEASAVSILRLSEAKLPLVSEKDNSLDYTKAIPATSFWKGTMYTHKDSIEAGISLQNGLVELTSVNSKWDGAAPIGPFLYNNVEGDFVFEAEVAEVSGQTEKRASANEVGLMVRNAAGKDRRSEGLLQNTILTGWGIGNITTTMEGGRREQQNTGVGWNFERFLQIQKTGNVFYLRSSKDGINWNELPGSPFRREDLNNKTLQVGLFQGSNNNVKGFGRFRNIKLYKH